MNRREKNETQNYIFNLKKLRYLTEFSFLNDANYVYILHDGTWSILAIVAYKGGNKQAKVQGKIQLILFYFFPDFFP